MGDEQQQAVVGETLESLALQAYEQKKIDDAAAAKAEDERRRRQEVEREARFAELAASYANQYSEILMPAFSNFLDLEVESPLLRDLVWSIYPGQWTDEIQDAFLDGNLAFIDEFRWPDLIVSIGGIPLELSIGQLVASGVLHVRYNLPSSSGPLQGMAHLGELILRQRQREVENQKAGNSRVW